MTPTQIARRSDALYADGTCGMTRRVLCDMVAQRESDIEDAREENNKLRKELEAAKHDLQVFSANLARLGAENAKLWELVKLLVNCVDRISNEDTFYYQPRRDGCGFDCTANGEGCSFIKLCEQARELGVEVTS